MTTADWALVVSLISLVTAMASFVWNVWSKFIYPKPKLRLSFMLMHVVGSRPKRRYLTLNVTNFGPGDVIVGCTVARPITPWYRRRVALAMLNPIDDLSRPHRPTGPYAGGLPKKLAVGEELTLYFPYDARMFMKEPLEAIGVHDSFRRAHWAPAGDWQKAVEQHRRDFPVRAEPT